MIATPPRLTRAREKLSDGIGQSIDCGHRCAGGIGIVLEDQVVGQNDAIAFSYRADFMVTITIEGHEREILVGTANAHLGAVVLD